MENPKLWGFLGVTAIHGVLRRESLRRWPLGTEWAALQLCHTEPRAGEGRPVCLLLLQTQGQANTAERRPAGGGQHGGAGTICSG